MTTPSRSPSTLELLLFFTAAIGILLAVAIFVLLTVVGFAAAGEGDSQMATFALWTGAGMAALALALTPAAYWSGRALFGAPRPPAGRPSAIWLAPILAYPFCLALGAWANAQTDSPASFAALALVGTAIVPVLVIAWTVRKLGPAITPTRSWGHFTVGLTGMPAVALALEAAVLLPVLVLLGLWLLGTAEGNELARLLDPAAGPQPDVATDLALRFVSSPLALVGVYGYIALAIPMIEELVKTMSVWPFLRRGLSPAQAFLGGALGGAGYALFEALFLTQPGEVWLLTTFARAGASLLHVFTAALTSWGLMEGVHRRRYGVMVGAFAAAITMHGLWNMSAVTIGISSVPVETPLPPVLEGLAGLAPLLLACLIAVSVLGLLTSWRRLETPAERESA